MTKRELFTSIKTDLMAAQENVADFNEKVAFIDDQIAQIDSKAEKARARAAEKRAIGDELRETIYGLLTSEPQTIPAITAQIEDETVSEAKVRARLSQLVQAERVAKEKVKTEAGEKMGYFIAQ